MRIVHFLHRIRTEDGPVVTNTLDLCSALAARGHDVTLVTSDSTDIPAAWKDGKAGRPRVLEIPPLVGPVKLMSRWSRRAMEQLLVSTDTLHIHQFWQPCAAQVALIAKRLGIPYVVSANGMLDEWSVAQGPIRKHAFISTVGRRMFRGAGAVHCTAEEEARQAARLGSTQQSCIAPALDEFEGLYARLCYGDLVMPATRSAAPIRLTASA